MPFCPCGQSQYQTTQAKNKETNQRVGQLPAGPQWNCDTELCQQFSPWMDPFQHFPANTRRHLNPSKQSMATGVSPPDHPVRRDAEWVATPEETLSGDLPGCFVVWSHRQHGHTSQLNIIARGSHRRRGRSKEEEEERSISTVQHLQHACGPVPAALTIEFRSNLRISTRTKPARTSKVAHKPERQTNWQQKCPPQGSGWVWAVQCYGTSRGILWKALPMQWTGLFGDAVPGSAKQVTREGKNIISF